MNFRTRLIVTLSAITGLTTVVAFGTASFVVIRSEERQLDHALRNEAREEAAEIMNEGRGRALQITDRGGPKADDVGRLTKYAVLYAEDGSILDHTDTFVRVAVPERRALPAELGIPFNLHHGQERLRAIVVAVPDSSQSKFLLAASREDLEKDTVFLWKVMFVTAFFSIGCIVLGSWRVIRQLTRGHAAITEAARKIAAGDLRTRVALTSGDDEVVQLAKDIDEMVRRLDLLVQGQIRFVAYAAHELRSPLTVLYGELQLALRRSRSPEEYRSTIEESLDAVQRLTRLAEDLLVLARTAIDQEQAHPPLTLAQVAQNAAFWVEPAAMQREVTLDIHADSSVVTTCGTLIERLLRNLLDNAVRHSPRGGRVVLRAHAHEDGIDLAVYDDGPGVAADERERIFEPFFRAAEERQRGTGSGLGLAIVREIARAHGGDVSVEDGPGGRGTVFRARLQVLSTPAEPEHLSPPQSLA